MQAGPNSSSLSPLGRVSPDAAHVLAERQAAIHFGQLLEVSACCEDSLKPGPMR
jgi:hypothetical protein